MSGSEKLQCAPSRQMAVYTYGIGIRVDKYKSTVSLNTSDLFRFMKTIKVKCGQSKHTDTKI